MVGGDILVGGVLLLSAAIAFWRGFVREVLSLAAWVGATLATLWGFAPARPYARAYIAPEWLADVALGFSLFIASLIVLSLLATWIGGLVRDSALSAVDRTLGFAFGLARGAAALALAFLALNWAMPENEQPDWLRQAKSRPLVAEAAEWLRELAPAEFRGRVGQGAEDADRLRRQAQDAERALRALGAMPQRPSPPGGEAGYNTQERRELDRLMRQAQPPSEGAPQR